MWYGVLPGTGAIILRTGDRGDPITGIIITGITTTGTGIITAITIAGIVTAIRITAETTITDTAMRRPLFAATATAEGIKIHIQGLKPVRKVHANSPNAILTLNAPL